MVRKPIIFLQLLLLYVIVVIISTTFKLTSYIIMISTLYFPALENISHIYYQFPPVCYFSRNSFHIMMYLMSVLSSPDKKYSRRGNIQPKYRLLRYVVYRVAYRFITKYHAGYRGQYRMAVFSVIYIYFIINIYLFSYKINCISVHIS